MRVALLVALVAVVAGSPVDATPLQKLLQMLEKVKARGFEEKHLEEVEFAKFKGCDETPRVAELEADISEGKAEVAQLEAVFDEAESYVVVFTEQIVGLEADLTRIEGEIESATEVHAREKTVLEAVQLDYSGSGDAFARAIDAFDRTQGSYDLMRRLTDDLRRGQEALIDALAGKATRWDDAARAKANWSGKSMEVGAWELLAEDEKALGDPNSECDARSQEYEGNQLVRTAELEAIQKATALMLELQQVSDTSLCQRVMRYLQGRAQKLGSDCLSLAAARAADDPLKQVKRMIEDMLRMLLERAGAEANRISFCDIKQAEAEELAVEVEQGPALGALLAAEVASLSRAIAQVHRAMAEANEVRTEGRAKNAAVVADAKGAQAAVEVAIKVLKGFYDNPTGAAKLRVELKAEEAIQMLRGANATDLLAEGAAFVADAKGAQAAAETAVKVLHSMDQPYTGMSTESFGVFGMLEVILSDFALLQTKVETSEDVAEMAHTRFMSDSEENVAELTHKELDGLRAGSRAGRALAYSEKLLPGCLGTGLSHKEEEIVSLENACRILEGEEVPL